MPLTLLTWQQNLITTHRVAHLATTSKHNQPSVLPVVYAFDGQQFFIPLDGKPKRASLGQLRRVRDIEQNPLVALVIDQYSEDWTQLAWLQVRGTATLIGEGELYEASIAALQLRYPQYVQVPLIGRPVIMIMPTEVRGWRAFEATDMA